jgi:hypothetical protein
VVNTGGTNAVDVDIQVADGANNRVIYRMAALPANGVLHIPSAGGAPAAGVAAGLSDTIVKLDSTTKSLELILTHVADTTVDWTTSGIERTNL